jgi:hypothetical protein
MKNILVLLTIAALAATSCKKNDSTAAKPSTPLIKGKWVYVGWTGGLTGVTTLQPATVSHIMQLKPDFTFINTYGTTTTTGTYSLSTSGSFNRINFIVPPSGSGYPPSIGGTLYNYATWADTLVLWMPYAADGMNSYFKKY